MYNWTSYKKNYSLLITGFNVFFYELIVYKWNIDIYFDTTDTCNLLNENVSSIDYDTTSFKDKQSVSNAK